MKEANLLQTQASTAQLSAPWRSARLQRKCACGGTPGPAGECESCRKQQRATERPPAKLQAKLVVTASGSALEEEADRAADSLGSSASRARLSSWNGDSLGDMTSPPIVDEVVASGGEPLDSATRDRMSSHFGHHFGDVRIHADSRAAESARAVRAHAYTVGSHIAFNAGRYAPATAAGQKLLAHELAHVVQQTAPGRHAVQRDDAKPEERIDVAIVFGDEADAMTEGKSYAPTAIRVTSGEDAKKKLLALGKPIGTIFVVSHSNRAGEVQVISGIGTISWVKLSDLSKDLKGIPADKAPALIDFRGCKLGDAPQEMETFRQNVGAQKARGMTCWSIVSVVTPLVLPDGTELTDPSQIPKGKEGEVDAALVKQVSGLKSADGHAVKDCIEGLAKGETAAKNMTKIKRLYFAHKGNLAAVWASPEYNYDWQKGSMCVKDLTDQTSPCKITTTAAPAAAPSGGQKKQGAMLERPSGTLYAGPDRVEGGDQLA
ncbi:MAG: DUF4157 domain-containing protein [Verrucomicrobiota bacterium]|nr:DUF4157 domain-containing protein [Chthoniobacterales bacterium]MDQ3415156.1 DUF4157 domain-containing protein [Verrucomicrobiota bacterium]